MLMNMLEMLLNEAYQDPELVIIGFILHICIGNGNRYQFRNLYLACSLSFSKIKVVRKRKE